MSSSYFSSFSSSRSFASNVEGSVGSHEDSSSSDTVVVRADNTQMADNSLSGATLGNPPLRARYDWVSTLVTKQSSKYRWLMFLEYFVVSVPMVTPGIEEGMVYTEKCLVIDRVCHSQEENESDFFFMYGVSLLMPMFVFP